MSEVPNVSRRETSIEMTFIPPSPSPCNRPCDSTSSRPSVRQSNVKFDQFEEVAFCCLKRESLPRKWSIELVSSPWFERTSILVILLNCVTLAMYNPFDKTCATKKCQILEILETAIYAFFVVEMLIKWMAMGVFGDLGYFKDSWNKLDCFIVLTGTFELAYGEGKYLSAVRSVRVLRPLKAINRVPSIRSLVVRLLDTLPMLGNVLAICFFIFAIFGIIAVQLWQGLLRARCFPQDLNSSIIKQYNLTEFYRPSFNGYFVCSLPENNGLSKCSPHNFNPYKVNNKVCNQSFLTTENTSSSHCVDWYQYYTLCRQSGENLHWGSVSFDNIGIATVVIFQIITLAGWSDIMYKIQDVHSFWNWIYFVFLVLLGSYFMTNLFFVVMTSQFQQKKQRKKEPMEKSRLQSRASVSTVSSCLTQQGCYTQLLQYLEHLCRRFKKYICSKIKMDKKSKRRRVRYSIQLKNRMENVKSIHHHHHHYHYCHHYVHRHPCRYRNEITYYPPTSNAPDTSTEQSSHPYLQSVDQTLRMSCDTSDLKIDPQIQVTAQATTVLYQDTGDNSSGEMVSTATANINIDGEECSKNVITYSKTAAPVTAYATKATEKTLEVACSCAARHSEDENVNVIKNAYNDYIYSFDDDNVGSPNTKKKCWVKIRDNLKAFVKSHFTRFIMVSIFLNTICMAIEHHGQPKKMTDILETVNVIFTSIFAIEMLIKIAAFGPYGYIKDKVNLFDGVIVIVSFIDIIAESGTSDLSVMKSFRLLRIFKLIRFMPQLRRQLDVMKLALDNVMSFLALLALFVFTSSILGMHVFGGKFQFANEDGQLVTSRANFDSLFWALVTVFQILTETDWDVVLFDGIRSLSSWSSLYFIFIMVIGDFILFNLLIAIIVEGFINHAVPEKNKNSQPEPSSPSAKLGHNPCISEKEPYFSCPDLHTMYPKHLQYSQQLIRCTSAPCQSWSNYKRQNTTFSQFHVSSLDGFKTEKDGKKNDKVQCQSLQKENTSLVFQIVKEVDYYATSCLKHRQDWSLFVFSPENKFRQLAKIDEHQWFNRVVLLFILINCIVMAMEEPGLDKNSEMGQFIQIMQYIFTAVFTIEMSIKVISMGLIIGPDTYLKSGWNIVDGIFVLISLVDLIVSLTTDGSGGIFRILRVFRAIRTLRPLRVIKRYPDLRLVVETLISSLKPIGNFFLISATFFVIFGILGVQLFKGKFYSCHDAKSSLKINNKDQCISNDGNWTNNVYNFDNLARALLTLFVFSTCDGWTTIMYSGIDAVDVNKQPKRDYAKWNVLYFIAFLLIGRFIVMNMLVGIVIENFHKCHDEQEQNSSSRETVNTRSNSPRNSISEVADHSNIHAYFDLAIAIVIGINVVCMAMEHYDQPKMLTLCLQYANYIFTFLFVLEAVLKLIAFGIRNYFKDRWNCLDMFIVILSIGGIILDGLATSDLRINPTIIRVIRVLRITRVLKLLKTAEGIRSLLDTIGKALPQVTKLGILYVLFFFIFGALGMELFGRISCKKNECNGLDDTHAHFQNFGYSVLTLFRVSTGDNWIGILQDTMSSKICNSGETEGCVIINNIAPVFFFSFFLITQFILLNIVIAVLMKHLEENTLSDKDESNEGMQS